VKILLHLSTSREFSDLVEISDSNDGVYKDGHLLGKCIMDILPSSPE
jgi:hypothetical protein